MKWSTDGWNKKCKFTDYLTKFPFSSVTSHIHKPKLETLYISQHLWLHKLQIFTLSSNTPKFNICFLIKCINLLCSVITEECYGSESNRYGREC